MSKGSGSTKGGPNGHSANSKKLTFKEVFNGHWEMDVPGVGGGQILKNEGYSKFEPVRYEAYAWDGDYNTFNGGAKKEFATLNAAKDYIKNAILKSK